MKLLLLTVGVFLVFAPKSLRADSVEGDKTVPFGDFVTSNWRSDDFKGSSSREWDASGKSFTWTWKTDAGDQIGRIGTAFGSKLLGGSIDDMPAESVMSTNATFTPTSNRWFWWTIYGWTNPVYTYWSNTKGGYNNEFYIIFHTDQPTDDFAKQKGLVAIGNVAVDGVTYDCFKTPRPSQSQWFAVARVRTWKASVNLKKIFAYWRTQGLGNESVVDLGWAAECFAGTGGKIEMKDVVIPDLSKK
jgi:hypothetical protein